MPSRRSRAALALLSVFTFAACKATVGGEDDAGPTQSPAGAPARVVISEIMYHPVLENDVVDNHEFIELANRSDAPVDIGGWRIEGGAKVTFAPGTRIPAGGYVVVASNKQRLLADVPAYQLTDAQVVAQYTGQLDNGGGAVTLLDAAGAQVDAVKYDDKFPWPLAADAFGASDQFFAPGDARLPFMAHQYRGHSLERVKLDGPSDELANWAPSPLDGATPGRPNAAAAAALSPVVERLGAFAAAGETSPIAPDAPVVVRAVFSRAGAPDSAQVEYFTEFKQGAPGDRTTAKVPMTAGPAGFEATLPPQPNNTIVRYRVLGADGAPLSPRRSDPAPFHSYAVVADVPGTSRAVHIFIAPKDWGQLWTNISPGRAPWPAQTFSDSLCKVNANWDLRVPGVFVADGVAHDARVRVQGSPYNRGNGPNLTKPFTGVPPTAGPNPLRALSWSIVFAKYAHFQSRGHIHLNKLTQACPGGLTTMVVPRLFAAAKVPSQTVFGFYRTFVNGGYYHYAMDREHVDDQMLQRIYGKNAPIGDLFKDVGFHDDQAVWGVGDARVLKEYCGFSLKQRYDATYERQTWEWKNGADDVRKLIEDLNAARAADLQAGDMQYANLRKFLADRFDLDMLLTYKALLNWANPWDDYFQNHYYYKRPDGKWIIIPYDFDNEMGGDANASFYNGEQNDRSARKCCDAWNMVSWWNVLFDSLIKAYRKEFNGKLLTLDATVLAPANVAKVVDDVVMTSGYNQDEARAAPAGTACGNDYLMTANGMKSWAMARHNALVQQIKP